MMSAWLFQPHEIFHENAPQISPTPRAKNIVMGESFPLKGCIKYSVLYWNSSFCWADVAYSALEESSWFLVVGEVDIALVVPGQDLFNYSVMEGTFTNPEVLLSTHTGTQKCSPCLNTPGKV